MDSNVDTDSLPPQEERIRRLYGNKKPVGHLDRFRQAKGRKQYFDSGEYAMAQAGKGDAINVGAMGRQHPSPDSIPHPVTPISANGSGPGSKIPSAVSTSGHHISQGGQSAGSPVKETSFLSRETSADDMEDDTEEIKGQNQAQQPEGQPQQQQQQQQEGDAAQHGADGLPIRT